MKIGDREIGGNNSTYIIAEAGTNHMGDMKRAYELVQDAVDAGADAIKFQAFKNRPFAPLFCPYKGDEGRIEYWNGTCLTYDEWGMVSERCHDLKIHFILSVFQEAALPFLDHCDAAKVASRAASTYPYDKVKLPIIISTGMGGPIDPVPEETWRMGCVAKYPTPVGDAIQLMKDGVSSTSESLNYFAFSDHTGTPLAGLYGIANGLSMLEVHFSSEKIGRDAVVELTVDELKLLCDFRDAVAP